MHICSKVIPLQTISMHIRIHIRIKEHRHPNFLESYRTVLRGL